MADTQLDFYSNYQVGRDGQVREVYPGPWCERVTVSNEVDILIDGQDPADSDWTALTGHTLQYGYNGAVMHASEGIGRSITDELTDLAKDGDIYVRVEPVEVDPEEYPEDYSPEQLADFHAGHWSPDPAGWCVLWQRVEVAR